MYLNESECLLWNNYQVCYQEYYQEHFLIMIIQYHNIIYNIIQYHNKHCDLLYITKAKKQTKMN